MKSDILILTTTRDFLEKFEVNNIKLLQELGYTVHYATNIEEPFFSFDEHRIRKMGVIIHHIDIARSPYMFNYNWKAFFQLVELIKKYNIKAIHCHTPVGGVLGRLVARYLKKRKLQIIYTAHGFHFYDGAPFLNNTVYYAVERYLARYTDVLITINHEDYQRAKKFHMKAGGKKYMIPSVGLDMERFHPFSEGERRRKRAEIGVKENDFFIVSVGELNGNKNQQIVLRALAMMKSQGKDISCVKYGICGDGVLKNKVRGLIHRLQLDDIVTLYGFTRYVPDILGCADVSVFPSIREGLGMAAIEALSMGIPVLAADNRGTREYMSDGWNGFVYNSKDMEGFASGIKSVMQMSDEEKRNMSENCRESVKKFEKSRTESVMKKIYEELDLRMRSESDAEK